MLKYIANRSDGGGDGGKGGSGGNGGCKGGGDRGKGEGGGEMSLRDTISLAFGDGRCFWPQKAKWGLLIGRDAGRHQAGSTSGKENLLSLRKNFAFGDGAEVIF